MAVRSVLIRYKIIKSSNLYNPLIENKSQGNDIEASNLIEKLQNKMRIQKIYTLLCGILVTQKETKINKTLDLKDLTEYDCKQIYQVTLNE